MRLTGSILILLAGGIAALSGCTTTRSHGEVEASLPDFPPPSPSRRVKPADSFGHPPANGDSSAQSWKSAVKIEVSVFEVGMEKAAMTKRELDFEKADLETLQQAYPGAELLAKPTVITKPGQVATVVSGVEIPVLDENTSEPTSQEFETILEGLMVSVLPAAPPDVGPGTPVSQVRGRDISLHVLAAINEADNFSRKEKNPVPVVRQFQIDRKLKLKPGVTTEVGRITRETTEYLIDKVPILADIPLIGQLPLFRREVVLELRRTAVIVVRAEWVGSSANT